MSFGISLSMIEIPQCDRHAGYVPAFRDGPGSPLTGFCVYPDMAARTGRAMWQEQGVDHCFRLAGTRLPRGRRENPVDVTLDGLMSYKDEVVGVSRAGAGLVTGLMNLKIKLLDRHPFP